MRRDFLEFVSGQHTEDLQLKSILKKEYAIEKRISRLRQLAEDRILVVERFRDALERQKWAAHLKEEEISQ